MNQMNINNARGELQIQNMKRIQKDGVCPFCPQHLKTYHEPPILREGAHWVVTFNMYPYQNSAYHFLFITKTHLTDTQDLSAEAWAELHEHIKWVDREYEIDCGTLLMRSGNMLKTGSSVSHLHAQFIVGSDPEKPIMTRVG